ncbi:AAA family ATPase [Streptomyces sp. Act143]|uniref:ATP-binding protein n=1 Tax=Streptomyces sp. Act143 TaxID=2200760 RepID=UPI00215B6869|nr:LuxR family transcriptional regulator [Streptomyces sp. Act143]
MRERGPVHTEVADGLVGREEALGAVGQFLHAASQTGGTQLLIGDAGIGKSVLLHRAAEMARAAGSSVVHSAGVEFEADVSYSGLHQILLPLEGDFDLLDPGPRKALEVALGFGVGPHPERAQVSEAVLDLISRAAARRPLLVIVDDVQWLDRASAGVLSFVARGLGGTRAGFLAAARLGLESHFEQVGLPQRVLGPLDDEAAAVLLRARFPQLTPGERAQLVTEAQGNPLALLELADDVASGAQSAMAPSAVVSPLRRLQTLFTARLNGLPAPTVRLVLRAALDATGDPRILQSTGPGSPGPGDLAPAEQARLIRVDEDARRIVFAHPLIRSAVVRQSTSSERHTAHRDLADLLADEPERRAWHLAEATVEPDEYVAGLLDDVAQRVLRRGDAGGAVSALVRAAELSPLGSDRSRRLSEAAYIGADVTGRLRDTPQLLAAARAADPGSDEPLHAAVAAAYILLTGEGDIDTAHRLLVGALKAFPTRGEARERVVNEAFRSLLLVCFFGGRPTLWDAFHDFLASSEGDGLVALCGVTFCDPARTDPDTLKRLDSLIADNDEERDPTRIVWLSIASVFVDRLSGLRQGLWRTVRDGREGGAVGSAINSMQLLGIDDFLTGRWDESQRLIDESVDLCDDLGYEIIAVPGRWGQGLLAAAHGDFTRAETLADEITRWGAPRGVRVAQIYAWQIRALVALGRGDYDEAYQQAAAISPAGEFAFRTPIALWVCMDLVEAAVRSNRPAEAAAHVAAMRDNDIAALSPRLALLATGSAAMAASDSTAAALFEEALALPGADRWPFELARVRLAYGEHLRRARAVTAAREQLSAARDAFQRLGARPWAARAESELLATSQTRSRVGKQGPDALTSREREIAMLAASGLSNKKIGERLNLSSRTVGAHLRHVFQKLGIASRAALRDALGPAPSPPHNPAE